MALPIFFVLDQTDVNVCLFGDYLLNSNSAICLPLKPNLWLSDINSSVGSRTRTNLTCQEYKYPFVYACGLFYVGIFPYCLASIQFLFKIPIS